MEPPGAPVVSAVPAGRDLGRRVERGLSWLIRGGRPAASHALLGPTALWLALFLLLPLLLLTALSFTPRGPYGAIRWDAYTLENFRRCLDPEYLPVLLRTAGYAAATTALCLALGYPFAYFLTFGAGRRKGPWLLLLILPFWTSTLVNLYAWMILLGREGILNRVLLALGLVEEPLKLLNRPGAVVLGLTYAYLPFMILPVYAALEKLPKAYIEAAKDLGAGPVRTFLRVTWPLSLHGVLAGGILTFIPCMGDFLVAEFLGGPESFLAGNLIQNQFLMAQDWPFGAALSVLLIAVLAAGTVLYQRLDEPDEAELRSLS